MEEEKKIEETLQLSSLSSSSSSAALSP